MGHDVFISHAVEDKQVADEVCRALEGEGVRCWIAPRDIPPGMDYEESIVEAISQSPVLILILSTHSNNSAHVRREVSRAFVEGSPTRVIPFRVEDVQYSKALSYYLGSVQWIDASQPPLEPRLRQLVQHVRANVVMDERAKVVQTVPHPGVNAPPPTIVPTGYAPRVKQVERAPDEPRRKMLAFVGGGVMLLAVMVAAFMSLKGLIINANSNGNGNVNIATPTPQRTPAQTPTATPTMTPTPRRPHNFNLKLPLNSKTVNRRAVINLNSNAANH